MGKFSLSPPGPPALMDDPPPPPPPSPMREPDPDIVLDSPPPPPRPVGGHGPVEEIEEIPILFDESPIIRVDNVDDCAEHCYIDENCLWYSYGDGLCVKMDSCKWVEEHGSEFVTGNTFCEDEGIFLKKFTE